MERGELPVMDRPVYTVAKLETELAEIPFQGSAIPAR